MAAYYPVSSTKARLVFCHPPISPNSIRRRLEVAAALPFTRTATQRSSTGPRATPDLITSRSPSDNRHLCFFCHYDDHEPFRFHVSLLMCRSRHHRTGTYKRLPARHPASMNRWALILITSGIEDVGSYALVFVMPKAKR